MKNEELKNIFKMSTVVLDLIRNLKMRRAPETSSG